MRHLVTLLFFVGAIAAYIAGSMPGAAALVIIGLFLELFGWYRIFHGKKQPPVSTH